MTAPDQTTDPEIEAIWREVLTEGHRGRWAFLPSDPRCQLCAQPFTGVGGALLRVFTGYRPASMTPNMCNLCEDQLPAGGAEVDIAVLFADLRGSTVLGEQLSASEFAALLNRFYDATSHVLVAAQSWIDKLVGDEVMALYIPAMGPDYRRRAVTTGIALLQAIGYRPGETPWLEVGVGVNAGPAYVGKVGAHGSNAVTALGDTVNTGARIQGQAAAGELLISEDLYETVADELPGIEQRHLEVKGKGETISVRVIHPAELTAPPV
jgi:adenylate cyclase